MSAKTIRRAAVNRLWLLLLAIFLGLAVLPWLRPASAPERAGEVASRPADGVAASLPEVPPLDSLEATRQRPLFVATRRPPRGIVAATPERPGLGNYRMRGAIVAGDARIVLLEGPDGKTLRLREGAEVDGWTVREITDDRIVLVEDDREVIIRLHDR
ncbi:hypothetical protein [Oceanibacterium hippocampi]|uniref:Type II secretion system protein GspC N-terminal domain-containing protein n=1 Tax=Oceanibacterium hippocampi TaxID=745714 RepID=A0A1Y5T6Q6_9PROT|nr:hypothetical protein [Oceanibacterium hippocampi]SLN56813.1 hypothetical protein OCH7691_02479 [Oceanibacterium hippocampi]